MMNEYFGFMRKPFTRDVQDKLYFWKDFQNLKFRLDHFIREGDIFLLTGAIGAGKTTALRSFAAGLNPNTHTMVYLNNAFERKHDFYRTLMGAFQLKPLFHMGDCRNLLKRHFQEMAMVKRNIPLIILDEVQNYPGFLLEEIRLLSNFDFDSKTIALFILSGHKLLLQRMSSLENEALRQRISIRFHLEAMNLEETFGYIRHHLTVAGSTASIFSDSVIPKIHEASQGIPRRVNRICSALLLAAAADQKKIVDDILFEGSKDEWK